MKSVTYSAPPVNLDSADTDPIAYYACLLDGRTVAIPGPEAARIRDLLAQYHRVQEDRAIDECLEAQGMNGDEPDDLDPIDPACRAWWAAHSRDLDRTAGTPAPARKFANGARRTWSEVLTDEEMLSSLIG